MNIYNNYSLANCTKNFMMFCAIFFIDKKNYLCYIRATKGNKRTGKQAGKEKIK